MCFWSQISVRTRIKDKQHSISKPINRKNTHFTFLSPQMISNFFFSAPTYPIDQSNGKDKHSISFPHWSLHDLKIFSVFSMPKNSSQFSPEPLLDYNPHWEQELYIAYICLLFNVRYIIDNKYWVKWTEFFFKVLNINWPSQTVQNIILV